MYLEASRGSPNQVARLVSPSLTLTNGHPKCLNFWYNMNGKNINSLTVYYRRRGQLGPAVWSRHGNQGTDWKPARVDITGDSPLQVVFEASRGTSYTGDIAIDDISEQDGSCLVTSDCNFDSGLCVWKQAHDDNFDWTWHQGSTTTPSTGPSSDHTTGSGHYLYTESSSPRRRGEKTRLVSPVHSATTGQCLVFYYYMYGTSMGTLNVYVQSVGGQPVKVWSESGNSRQHFWLLGNVTLSSTHNFNIVFEGVIGTSYYSDMAIDDISVSGTPCELKAPISSSESCDFELSGYCGFSQEITDNFDWTRGSGSTPTTNTGPPSDHTLGNKEGHYVYIETSSPKLPRHVARLDTLPLSGPTSPTCLMFWFYMSGSTVGTLNVYIQRNGKKGTPVWSRSGNQGNTWKSAKIRVPMVTTTTSQYQVVYEGIVGGGPYGDIAIDDFNVTQGSCSSKAVIFKCDFEKRDICGFTDRSGPGETHWLYNNYITSTKPGPTTDHTLGNAIGHYIYIYTPSNRHQKAQVNSFPMTGSTKPRCVTFWYHMEGYDVGSLNVYTVISGTTAKQIWHETGNQGNVWKRANVQLVAMKSTLPFRIVFEGVMNISQHPAHIAFDDFSFLDGQCPVETTTKPPTPIGTFNCDFTKDLCGWTQGDKLNWTRHHSHTSTSNTGPNYDHTTGNDTGYYIHIDVTGSTLGHGHTAELLSPTVAPGQSCIIFWYNMLGSQVGSLTLYIQTGAPQTRKLMWMRSGNQGLRWIQGKIDTNVTMSYRVVLEGSKVAGSHGDIAVDDISLIHGPCTIGTTGAFNCDFQNDICGWTKVTGGDQFNWTRNHGEKQSNNSGPENDHTTGSINDYYISIETSGSNLLEGDMAQLLSPVVDPGPSCIMFWYSMYVKDVGTLSAYIQFGETMSPHPIWTRKGNQGSNWIQGEIFVNLQTQYQVVFEGTKGLGSHGHIVLDDISLNHGPCTTALTTHRSVQKTTTTTTAKPRTITNASEPTTTSISPKLIVAGTTAKPTPTTTITITTTKVTTPKITTNTTHTETTGTFNCDFQKDLCGWIEVTGGNQFHWTRSNGENQWNNSGPGNDHTTGRISTNGYYISIETSGSNLLEGDKAQLLSPVVDPGPSCIMFWYSMYGEDVGTLSAYIQFGETMSPHPIWTRKGNQGSNWIQGEIFVNTVSGCS